MTKLTSIPRTGDNLSYPVGSDMEAAVEQAKACAEYIQKVAKEKNAHGIWVYCRGSSGSILAAITCSMIHDVKCVVSHIKKEGESSHADWVLPAPKDWLSVIIDDFVCSGDTISKIMKAAMATGETKFDVLIVQWSSTSPTAQEVLRKVELHIPSAGTRIEEVVVVTPAGQR